MPISKSRRLFGGIKLTFKCPTCGATMPVSPKNVRTDEKLACKSCAAKHTLSSADIALLSET